MANFVSNDNATSLMNAINQKKDSKPSTITWAEWIALTDEQREGTHYIITNVPAKFSDKDAVFSIKDQTLTFTNKTATVTDSRITTDTYIFTFYHNQAVAQAAGIECSWTTGTVTFTVDENPSEDIVVDILCILPALATPSSEGGGHSIIDSSGSTMPQESAMQFADSHVSDDSTNGRTVVENVKEHTTKADYDNATEDGFHVIDDGNDALIGAVSDDYVEVTADGNTTWIVILNYIFNHTDLSKITPNANLYIAGTYHPLVTKTNVLLAFAKTRTISNTQLETSTFVLQASNSHCDDCNLTSGSPASASITDNSTNKPSSGAVITLYYGNKKATVDLQTTANRCLMSDGSTVQSSLDSISNPSRASVSVLTYAVGLSEGIHFYTTSANTADNPATGSHMFMIFKAATGITVFGMSLASRGAFLNASANSGNTWSGWKAFSLV